ncbi:MAG: ComF family protein [Jaaginema sp. PMC 1079.18]|nr:ComF family protein [Jaaginema sp. PMC 1080.18]MEC4850578.1 ComF family protein [Jaaginema sp. PMC 1079.18]MEC4866685.1 ComF family protein [Jaaginema sp. PMC 1078.18]
MLKTLTSLFLQSHCSLCDRVTPDNICPACDRQLQRQKFSHPERFWQGELPLFVWGQYNGILKRSLATLKYNNQPELAQLLGYYLGQSWRSFVPTLTQKRFVLVPIPLHPRKLQERGFNQAELLGRSFCRVTGDRLNSRLLLRQKDTQAMFGLSPQEREQNIKAAFSVQPPRRQIPPVLLIDDIYTTGTTARSAATVLRENDIAVVGIVAIATSSSLGQSAVGNRQS